VLLGAFERFGLAEPGGAELVQVGKAAGVTLRAKVQRQGPLAEDDEPSWAKDLVETVATGMAGPVFEAPVNPGCRTCPGAASCPPGGPGGEKVTPGPRGSSRRGDVRAAGRRHAGDMTEWPDRPVIYEVNTAIWLSDLSRAAGRRVTLADVPASAWDEVTPDGIDAVWLMGVWERSPAGLELANANAGLQAS